MYNAIDATRVLFLDIETVSEQPDYGSLSEEMQALWQHKARSVLKRWNGEEITDEEYASSYQDAAGIFAEFGKIVCISVGVVYRDKDSGKLGIRLKSYAHRDEAELLRGFDELLRQYYDDPNRYFLCGHNVKEFDVPYLCRRMLVNRLPLPRMLDIAGKKPWETKHLADTLEMWKFGDRKNFTSLKLLAAVLGFPSPKDDIDGSMVGRVFWENDELDRIAHYCEKDVLATAQLFLRYQLKPLIEDDMIHHVGE